MKTRVLLAAVAVAFSFAVTSCGNKKAADANEAAGGSCCATKSEQSCGSAKSDCQAGESVACGDSAKCEKGACDKAKCDKKACDKK